MQALPVFVFFVFFVLSVIPPTLRPFGAFTAGASPFGDVRQCLADDVAAMGVLGQPNFTSANSGTSNTTFWNPVILRTNPATGDLYVADSSNSRVLVFFNDSFVGQVAAQGGTTNYSGIVADRVLGQPSFTANGLSCTQTSFYFPTDAFVDANDRLWVADRNCHRVLMFRNITVHLRANRTTPPAHLVIGRPDFVSQGGGQQDNRFDSAFVVMHDEIDDRLWVSDPGNRRVQRFDNVSSVSFPQANASAVGCLGDLPDCSTQGSTATTRRSTHSPNGLALDSAQNLFVADRLNKRVLRFNRSAYLATLVGPEADAVFGAPNFTTPGSVYAFYITIVPGPLSWNGYPLLLVTDVFGLEKKRTHV